MTDHTLSSPPQPWQLLLRLHIQAHPKVAMALAIALAGVLLLLLQSLIAIAAGDLTPGAHYGIIGGLAGFAATALGALPALVLRSIPQRVEDTMLGFAAGMMLAASAFSLLLPGLEAAEGFTGNPFLAAAVVVLGMGLGVLLMLGLDQFTPHEHDKSGPCGPGHQNCSRVWLFVFAIALHNLPEGMAIGVSFSQGDMKVGLPLTTAIALQDIPEGLAVALAIIAAGYKPLPAVLIAILSGLLEPVGALVGIGLSSGMAIAYPIGLGLAAGAMLFVVSHEVIPETHRNGHQTFATLGLMGGFALMMTLDTALG
ncbi:ZIP family metal transporter [Aeromonas simiae]|nr:ZIP family metal transporter [Aeromonas simiae]MDO2949310.1 ZIP family metal transporter [Aeromonas simiae]MDO2952774.1 ZIP family metal transporter [Aeromonas simiae]MDO2956567.1 ZIP family metal transporter [Aeromonas simiae]